MRKINKISLKLRTGLICSLFLGSFATSFAQHGMMGHSDFQKISTDSNFLKHNVYVLADPSFVGRGLGTVGDSLAAHYISGLFQEMGLKTWFSYDSLSKQVKNNPDYFQWFDMKSPWNEYFRTHNVVGFVPGTDSALSKEYVIMGAHYDHLGMGGPKSTSLQQDTFAVHPGADDNASGVSSILAMAKYFAKHPAKRSIVFVCFSAEETGLVGSKTFIEMLPFDKSKIQVMINLDMVGCLRDSNLTLNGTGTSPNSLMYAQMLARKHPALKVEDVPDGYGPSDHAMFYTNGIPVYFFTTGGHERYHKPSDQPQFLNYTGMAQVADYAAELCEILANTDEKLAYQKAGSDHSVMRKGHFKVTLGMMPDMNSTITNGLKAQIVIEGKPAYKAGLRSGDLILSFNGKVIHNIEEYMDFLTKQKPGEKIKLKVERKGKIIKMVVQV